MLLLLASLSIAASDATRVGAPVARRFPERAPAAVGMSAERLATIRRVVQRGVEAGGFPGAAVVVGRKGYAVFSQGFGTLDWTRRARVSADASLYDVASLTKVVATTTAMMVLYDRGLVELDTPVAHYLPEFTGERREQVTVRHLLTHRGGLPAGRELWRLASTPAQARQAVLRSPIQCPPGTCYTYSDLGADLLGFIVEAVADRPLQLFLQDEVFHRLGMRDTRFGVDPDEVARTAPTEVAPPRGYPLRGEVHDENAWALGGVAGHAGLFSTATDLAVFAQMLLNGGVYEGVRIVSDSTVTLFTRRAAGRRALGWDTCDGDGGCGQYMSPKAFGHTGYTGTSLWIDPDRQTFVILLTNRIHAAKARRPAKVIADVRNDLADAATLAVLDDPGGVLAMPASFRADLAEDWNRPVRTRAQSAAARRRAAAARAAAARRARGTAGTATAGTATAGKTGARTATAGRATKPTAKKPTAKKPRATAKSATTAKRSGANTAAAKKRGGKVVGEKRPAKGSKGRGATG